MSLRARLTLAITLLVAVTLVLVWTFSVRSVLRPFAAEVFGAFADNAVFVAERVDAGEDPAAIGRALGLDVRRVDGPPPDRRGRGRGRGRGGGGPGGELELIERGGHTLAFRPGARNHIFVRTDRGWLVVRRSLDLDRPRRKLGLFLPFAGLGIVLVASALAAASTRPLDTARGAMERIADGDLDHRLDPGGPPELARVATAFNRMADRISGLLRTERELLAGISHELRTPLTRLRLETELLREAGASSRRLDAMEGDLAELDTLITELLTLSRLQLGDAVLAPEPLDLRAVATEAVAQADLSDRDVSIVGTASPIRGDRGLLLRAITNLLRNAGRYAPEGSIRVVLRERRLDVEDEGPGVASDALPRLFEPFFRAERSRSRRTGGVGLGLMIVRQVVELHGGRVHAENRAEGGLRVALDFGDRAGPPPAL